MLSISILAASIPVKTPVATTTSQGIVESHTRATSPCRPPASPSAWRRTRSFEFSWPQSILDESWSATRSRVVVQSGSPEGNRRGRKRSLPPGVEEMDELRCELQVGRGVSCQGAGRTNRSA